MLPHLKKNNTLLMTICSQINQTMCLLRVHVGVVDPALWVHIWSPSSSLNHRSIWSRAATQELWELNHPLVVRKWDTIWQDKTSYLYSHALVRSKTESKKLDYFFWSPLAHRCICVLFFWIFMCGSSLHCVNLKEMHSGKKLDQSIFLLSWSYWMNSLLMKALKALNWITMCLAGFNESRLFQNVVCTIKKSFSRATENTLFVGVIKTWVKALKTIETSYKAIKVRW